MRTALIPVFITTIELMAQTGTRIARDTPVWQALQQNSISLEAALELDRAEYFPSEIMVIDISFRNGTRQALQVFDPWQPYGLYLRFEPDRTVEADREHPQQFSNRLERGTIRIPSCSGVPLVLQPGEVRKREIRSDQPMPWQGHPLARFSNAPRAPGAYILAARYCGREFSKAFRVVKVKDEGHAKLKLSTPRITRMTDGSMRESEPTVEGFVLSYGGKRYLAIRGRPGSFPLVRIAELDPGDSLVALEEESGGSITARIQLANGELRFVAVPQSDQQ